MEEAGLTRRPVRPPRSEMMLCVMKRPHPEPSHDRPSAARVHVLCCVECGARSGLYARGWRGYRTDDPDSGESPRLGFYCPTCAAREFD